MIPEHVVQLAALFDLEDIETAYRAVREADVSQVLVDCAGVAVWPTSRVAVLCDLLRRFDRKTIAWSVNGMPADAHKELEFLLYRKSSRLRVRQEQPTRLMDRTLTRTAMGLKSAMVLFRLLQDIVYWALLGPFARHGFRFARSMYEVAERGVRSLPIVMLVSGIMGLILAMQAAVQLRMFGATIYVANLVAVSVTYELGPLLAALLMAGRSGSAITAEIGSMVTSEEMDALRAMGVSITKYVIVPKFIALVLTLPCLAVFANMTAIAASYLFCVFGLGLPGAEYIDQTINVLNLKDVMIGLIKAAADGVVISCIAVYQGLTTKGGAEGMGRSTTRSVVHSIIGIAITHLLFTMLFYATGQTAQFKR